MPGRNFVGANSYRHGYQGQFSEKDDETNLNSFELRMYDPRLARWMSPDPMGQYHSPYNAMGNNPINMVDPNGGHTTDNIHYYSDGTKTVTKTNDNFDRIYFNGSFEGYAAKGSSSMFSDGMGFSGVRFNEYHFPTNNFNFNSFNNKTSDFRLGLGTVAALTETAANSAMRDAARQALAKRAITTETRAFFGTMGKISSVASVAGKALGWYGVLESGSQWWQNPSWGGAGKVLINVGFTVGKANPVMLGASLIYTGLESSGQIDKWLGIKK